MEDVLDRAAEQPGARRYSNYVALRCPWHSDNRASLLVYEDGFKCLGCDAHGSPEYLFKFLGGSVVPTNDTSTWEYISGVYNLCKTRTPYEIAALAHRKLIVDTPAKRYLEARGISEAITPCNLGVYDGWICVPIYEGNEIAGVFFRSTPGVQEKSGIRFYQQKGQTPLPYYPDRTRKSVDRAPYLLVVFGLFDAITLALLGYPVVTGSTGMSTVRHEWFDDIRKPIIIIPDQNEMPAGVKLAGQLDWRGHVLKLDYPEGCKDSNDFVQTGKTELLDSQIRNYLWQSIIKQSQK